MTASELVADVAAPAFAVVAKWSERPLVRHIALLSEDTTLSKEKRVFVYDMGPPLRAGQPDVRGHPLRLPMAPDVYGWVELTEEESRAVQQNIEDIKTQIPHPTTRTREAPEARAQYCALPAWKTGADGLLRCSCVGFILLAYRDVKMFLAEDSLPDVVASLVNSIWPVSPEERAAFGLEGTGPWKVILPGYIFHALVASSLPYTAQSGNEAFPI